MLKRDDRAVGTSIIVVVADTDRTPKRKLTIKRTSREHTVAKEFIKTTYTVHPKTHAHKRRNECARAQTRIAGRPPPTYRFFITATVSPPQRDETPFPRNVSVSGP